MTDKKKILIIEDEQTLQMIFKEYFARQYEIVGVSNGEIGLKAVKEERPDLIILDLYIPALSGVSVYRKLQDEPESKNIPVIVISSGAIPPEKSMKDFNVPPEHILHKPFSWVDLNEKLAMIFNKSSVS